MTLQEQIDYIMESLERLAESLMIIQPNLQLRPSTVNVTLSLYQMLSKRKGKVIRFMFGASIRCPRPANSQAVKTRVENFQTLKWASM
jgi:hypothetical protein